MASGFDSRTDVLVVFAFDHTLAATDSDVHISRELSPEVANTVWTSHKAGEVDRSKVMDEFFVQLARKRPPVSSEDIRDAAGRLPFSQGVVDALRFAVDDFGATCVILTDATSFCVRSFLESHEVADRVGELVANPTHFEDAGKTLRVRSYHGSHIAPHGCPNCPSNLCKGFEVERILQQRHFSRILYVGGESGDLCAATKLLRDDVVLARVGGGEGHPNELFPRLNAHPEKLLPLIRQWRTGEEVVAILRSFFDELHSSPNESELVMNTAHRREDHAIPRDVSPSHEKVLVVFDFDESLVNEDSDTFAFRCFYPELVKTLGSRHAKNPVWPDVFDELHQILASDKPEVTPEDICKRVAQIPFQERMVDAVRMAVDVFKAHVKIISDGNSLFIDSVLKHQELSQHWCPSNLCKGSVLDSIRRAQSYSRVLYVGDGPGDFCAASRLARNDIVFARADEASGRSFGLQKLLDANPNMVQASVVPWIRVRWRCILVSKPSFWP
ncbi:Pyridoxal phosphate phosphatase [Phytophthora cinnamomi]|uniref:Pyridoxal phosphate phosphatase n=1 Tax=Phytophthora cinnamomi TaxID=4785 RepID=UPI003559DF35|nr:Pyridoxal phosphate phosphatase [Phytophthora cinnamomi]